MSNPQHEPTMEEILASIRKIISEDSTEEEPQRAAAPEPTPEPVPVPVPTHEPAPAPVLEAVVTPAPEVDDVLELTDVVAEEPAAEPEPIAEPVAEQADEIVFEPIEEEPAMSEPVAAAPEPVARPQIPSESRSEGIFSEKSRKALDDAFDSIEPEEEPKPAPDYRPAAPVPGLAGRSVEAVFDTAVREAFDPVLREWLGEHTGAIIERMKPVIREWMDEHFPALLEGAVRNEVERVVRSRGGK